MKPIIFLLAMIVSFGAHTTLTLAQDEEETPDISNVFATFSPFSVHVIKDRRIRGILMVDFKLSLKAREDVDEIDKIRPRIRSAVIEALTRVANARVNVRRPLDVELISNSIQGAIDSVLGEDFAKVLIAVASTQPR